MKTIGLFATLLILLNSSGFLWAKKGKGTAANQTEAKVLVLGLNDNVKSNYYYMGLIAEETGMQVDSIDQLYNSIIAQNIVATSNGLCKFIQGVDDHSYDAMIGKIEVTGEGENCTSNLSNVSGEELEAALSHANADYLLVLNQHYLKLQEEPMRTVFHMVSYTLYDKEKKQIYSGNQYFTSINLEVPGKVLVTSRKSSSKIASSVAKSLNP